MSVTPSAPFKFKLSLLHVKGTYQGTDWKVLPLGATFISYCEVDTDVIKFITALDTYFSHLSPNAKAYGPRVQHFRSTGESTVLIHHYAFSSLNVDSTEPRIITVEVNEVIYHGQKCINLVHVPEVSDEKGENTEEGENLASNIDMGNLSIIERK